MSYPESEGLQVNTYSEGLHVNTYNEGLHLHLNTHNEGLHVNTSALDSTKSPVAYLKEGNVVEQPGIGRGGRVCGLARRTFWVVFVIAAIVILAAAIGGGIGGSITKKNNNKSADSQRLVLSICTGDLEL